MPRFKLKGSSIPVADLSISPNFERTETPELSLRIDTTASYGRWLLSFTGLTKQDEMLIRRGKKVYLQLIRRRARASDKRNPDDGTGIYTNPSKETMPHALGEGTKYVEGDEKKPGNYYYESQIPYSRARFNITRQVLSGALREDYEISHKIRNFLNSLSQTFYMKRGSLINYLGLETTLPDSYDIETFLQYWNYTDISEVTTTGEYHTTISVAILIGKPDDPKGKKYILPEDITIKFRNAGNQVNFKNIYAISNTEVIIS